MQSLGIILRICLLWGFGYFIAPVSAQGLLQSPSRETRIADIRVEGNKTVDKPLIIKTIQVVRGESYIPPVLRNKIQGSVTALNKLNLFSDVRV